MAIIHHAKNGLREKIQRLEEKPKELIESKKQDAWSNNKKTIIKYIIISGIIILLSLIMSSEHILRLLTDRDYFQAQVPENERERYIIFLALFTVVSCIPHLGFWTFVFGRAIPIVSAIYVIYSIYDKWERVYPNNYLKLVDNNEIEILRAGLDGEEAALNKLKRLPDSYHIFTNRELSYGEKHSETDIIVVGPTGVFIIEVKNHKGVISGTVSDEQLLQFKHYDDYNRYRNYGTVREAKEVYNPVKQIGTHIWCLSHVLQDKHIRTWVSGCVLFVNSEANIQINGRSNSDIPIYVADEIDEMRNYICAQGTHTLLPDDIENIVRILSA